MTMTIVGIALLIILLAGTFVSDGPRRRWLQRIGYGGLVIAVLWNGVAQGEVHYPSLLIALLALVLLARSEREGRGGVSFAGSE